MRLYKGGRLATVEATEEAARAALADLQRAGFGELELRDGRRSLSLTREGGAWFVDYADPTIMFGTVAWGAGAAQALTTFLKGGVPAVAPAFPLPGDKDVAHIVMGDAAHPDCPLCRMMGLG